MRTVLSVFAVALIVLGVTLYLATGRESATALIPAFFGAGLGICALVATTARRQKHAMHAAVLLALLGFGGSVSGIPAAVRHLAGEAIERPEAAYGRSLMALLCLAFTVIAIRSFVQVRRKRLAEANSQA